MLVQTSKSVKKIRQKVLTECLHRLFAAEILIFEISSSRILVVTEILDKWFHFVDAKLLIIFLKCITAA